MVNLPLGRPSGAPGKRTKKNNSTTKNNSKALIAKLELLAESHSNPTDTPKKTGAFTEAQNSTTTTTPMTADEHNVLLIELGQSLERFNQRLSERIKTSTTANKPNSPLRKKTTKTPISQSPNTPSTNNNIINKDKNNHTKDEENAAGPPL